MKYVLLLGDSIRQNYQEYVRAQLEPIADVRYPNDNGRFGYYTLRYVHEWINALTREDCIEFDVVHFNCGLWDVLRLAGEEMPFVEEKEYRKVLIRIYEQLKKYCPNAKLIFALTTKVVEPGFSKGIEYASRSNRDIVRYNEIAEDTFRNTDVEINDLWSVSEQMRPMAYSDDVHFETEEGIKMLGDAVTKCVKKYL